VKLPTPADLALAPRAALLALDVGKARIGVAISDIDRDLAFPVTVLRRTKFQADAKALLRLADERGADAIVIGLPLEADGRFGPQAQSVESFGRHLGKLTSLPIAYMDERYSTVAADDRLIEAGASTRERRGAIDAHAAVEILERALAARGEGGA
jgi:putative holliday junction resolvase